jgi:hypothetical protein
MSQPPSVPPPGAYASPQSPQPQGFAQQPHYGYQQPQAPSQHGAHAPGYTPSASQKPTKAIGQVFNQAVTQSKPMLDKLSKSITSKLGNKHSKPVYNPQSTPQNNYQNYQQHHQYGQPQVQQYQQPQSHNYPNQSQQFTPGSQSVYQTPQQSPFSQSTHGTPASGNSGQSNNYFPQQATPNPHQQAPQYQQAPPQAPPQAPYQQSNSPSLHANPAEHAHTHSQQPGQPGQGQFTQTLYGQDSGQQTGVIGGAQPPSQHNFQQHAPSTNAYPPEKQQHQQQQQWAPPAPTQHQHVSAPQSPVPTPGEQQQQQQWIPHQHPSPAPQSPVHVQPTPPPQQYNAGPPVPVHPNQPQAQQSPQSQNQQWTSIPPVTPQAQQAQPSTSESSPAPQVSELQKPATSVAIAPQQQQHSQTEVPQQKPAQSPTSASQEGPSSAGPMGFIAELPADLGSMSPVESPRAEQAPSDASQAALYRAYRPVSGSTAPPGPSYTIARRAVSTSSLPLADPWRFADPVTELPTREFYIIADVVFDGIDRRFEPHNTGLLEASKVLESWKAQQLPAEAAGMSCTVSR